MFLPNIVLPEDGELLISWILRLAIANGFSNIATFVNEHMYGSPGYQLSIIDERLPFSKLYNSLGLDIPMWELFDRVSMVPRIGPFYTDFKTWATYHSSFYKPFGYTFPVKASMVSSSLIRPRICPICWKENQIMWQKHNFPGVTVCPDHGVPLLEYHLKKARYDHKNLLDLSSYVPLQADDSERELEISKYIVDFSERRYDISKEKIYLFLYDYIDPNPRYLNGRKMRDGFGLYEGCIKIMSMFPDLNELDKILQEYITIPDKEEISRLGYDLISPPKFNRLELKHRKCGTDFISNYKSIVDGFGCPCCSAKKSDFAKVKNIVDKKSSGKYKLISLEPRARMNIRHSCGSIKNIRISDWISYMPACTGCDEARKKSDRARIHNRVKTRSNGKLIFIKKLKHGLNEYQCTVCGRTFSAYDSSFRERPFCRYCEEEKNMKKKVDKQVSGTLSVVKYPSNEDRNVILHCSVCDEDFSAPFRNLSGQVYRNGDGTVSSHMPTYRCPICGVTKNKKVGKVYRIIKEHFPDRPFKVCELRQFFDEPFNPYSFVELMLKKGLIRKAEYPHSLGWYTIVEKKN